MDWILHGKRYCLEDFFRKRRNLNMENSMNDQTAIFKQTVYGERPIGVLNKDGTLLKTSGRDTIVVGRVADNRILRKTTYDEQELGFFTAIPASETGVK